MNLLLLTLGFLLGNGSAAALDEGFFPPSELPQGHRPQGLDRVVRASHRIDLDVARCSGSFISSEGHFITAAHCFGPFAKALGNVVVENGEHHQVVRIKKQRPSAYKHELIELRELKLTHGQVLFFGKGFTTFDDREVMGAISDDAFERVITWSGDFAVLKFDMKGKKSPCVPISRSALVPGDPVWMAAFPGPNTRPNGYGSNGGRELVSYGRIRSDLSENEYFRESGFSTEKMTLLSRYYAAPHKFISDMDGFPGVSGSLVVNTRGEGVGIMTTGAMHSPGVNQSRFINSAAVGVRMTSIYNEMSRFFSKAELSRIFHCVL